MKRILLLIKGLGRGGAEQLLLSAAPHLDRSRFRYEVAYILPMKDALVQPLEELGLPVHCLGGTRGGGWAFRLRSMVREKRIDLVHAHLPYAAVGARLGLRLPPTHGRRCALVYTEHNVWGCYHPLTRWANLLTLPMSDHVFTVSEAVGRSMRSPRWLPLRPPAIETLHHGLDWNDFSQTAMTPTARREFWIPLSAPLIGTVANFRREKGHRYLLEAFGKVREAHPDTRLLLVGQGPLEGETRRRAADQGLDGSVIFAGYRDDALRILPTFDVFVLPSQHEGLSIALLEAMALGRPIVATRVGGVPEVVEDGVTGFLVPPRDPAALAAAIVTLLESPALRERMGEAARRRATHFDIRSSVRRVEQVYEELLT
jgi:glycosyltransferase involved in cell wall biosynthesis